MERMLGTPRHALATPNEINSYAFVHKEGLWWRSGQAAKEANSRGTLEFDLLTGGLDEWFKSHAWKACLG